MTATALYRGRVSHARTTPRPHAFSYDTCMLALDLDDLGEQRWMPVFGIERVAPLSFRRRDYRGDPSRSLRQAIEDDVERALGFRPAGPIVLLTHVRVLGFVFNPVSFYFCHDEPGGRLVAVVAEITNTPWGERHAYVLAAQDGSVEASFPKTFHVSPFMPMEQLYRWRISPLADGVTIEMSNIEQGESVFVARLAMKRVAMTRTQLAKAAFAIPFIGLNVVFRIYWQALRLALKGTPFFAHPKHALLEQNRSSP